MPVRAYFWPRTRYHFNELESILKVTSSKYNEKRQRIEENLEPGKLRVSKNPAKHYSYLDPEGKQHTSSDNEVLSFDVVPKSSLASEPKSEGEVLTLPGEPVLHCEFYSPGLLEIEGERQQLDSYADSIFRGIYSVWPYVSLTMKSLPLEAASREGSETEDDAAIMVRCCEQFVKVVVDAFREKEVVERLKGPINSEGYVWNFIFERTRLGSKAITSESTGDGQRKPGTTQTKAEQTAKPGRGQPGTEEIRDSVDFRLLYIFDAGEYLRQTQESLEYFDAHIRGGGDNLKEELKNIKFMIEWARMRNQRAQNIFSLESRGAQLRLGNIVLLLTYETIVLTLVQVARSFFDVSTLLGNPWFLRFVVIGIVVGPIALFLFELRDALRKRHRRSITSPKKQNSFESTLLV